MSKAFFRQNPTTLEWECGTFMADGETPDVEYVLPAGLYRKRWQTVNSVVQLTISNANNIGEIEPFRSIPITDVASDLIGTPYADRAAFDTATKGFFFRVGGGSSKISTYTGDDATTNFAVPGDFVSALFVLNPYSVPFTIVTIGSLKYVHFTEAPVTGDFPQLVYVS
jgi:hypothetical protein